MSGDVHRKGLRIPFPKKLIERIQGQRVQGITRRAKYILIDLDGGETLVCHLGMSGRMVVTKKQISVGKHDHLMVRFDNGICLTFNDPRRFGLCDLVETNKLNSYKWLRYLGVEPLSTQLTPAFLEQALRGKMTSIKAALLDQQTVVGIGNIYASEALFMAGIHPKRCAGSCHKEDIARLVPGIKKVLKAAIKAGGSSLRDYVHADGKAGYFQHRFSVYGRAGEPCPTCSSPIKRITQNGRSSFYCLACQK